ncbi:hypothetical protein BO94DRAFT_625955 [Aspergillus sclerotioniger CBS 115572]|uniref:Zn(2)-C6 fungal-type domain-containing protein n=1 Tax=Aspergillus sclerotioniger CBS 115572 TaxID=1450535 RepID=A0A317W2G6_9EURO|nr:hypothetical protein BO94DRAFT_625955 [Aspergillus sclerotioniger CBS 115572]PWY80826.1 hypothetical protein BO94DRAFT_625955 [Aspergillus sclerotioniger CBS 115572]
MESITDTSLEGLSSSGRPYRSHTHPACLPCRKRKSACRTRDASATCILCLVHGTNCIFPQADSRSQRRHVDSPRRLAPKERHARIVQHRENRRPLPTPQVVLPPTDTGPDRTDSQTKNADDGLPSLMGVTDTGDDGSHIVSPAIADDTEVLESYLSTVPDARKRCFRTSSSSSRPIRPVLFSTIPRRPLGVYSHQSLPAMKLEVIEKYLEPVTRDVVNLFFRYANICFPIFDEASFLTIYTTHKEKISPALLCTLYAISLIYWNNSSKLRSLRPPDIRYIWNQAIEAIHSELFLSPGISTVMAMLLNISGRPSTSIFGNGGMVGTAVALANALGLNRDPSQWTISPVEKRFRIRAASPTEPPLQIHRAQYDVPIPTISDICPPNSSSVQLSAAYIFIALTTLTETLTLYLEHIYHVSQTLTPPPLALSSLLTNWESSLPPQTRHIILRGTDLTAPGAANLRLAYLAVKLLRGRIELDHTHPHPHSPISNEDGNTHRAAESIIHFIQELDSSHLAGFWLPGLAYSITSAVMFLVRSAVREKIDGYGSGGVKWEDALNLARDAITTLRSHREKSNWDLADDCLAKCSEVVERVGMVHDGGEEDDSSFGPGIDLDIDSVVWDDLFLGGGFFGGME